MSVLKICKYGDPVLQKKCKLVGEFDPALNKLIMDMLETMYAAPGVGLAANQVGIPVRLCVIDVHPNGRKQPMVLINPRISSKKGRVKEEEGCLSLPGILAKVKRFNEVCVEALNENAMPVIIEGKDLLARALQHELDHLDGKTFVDSVSLWEKAKIKREIKRRKKEGTW